MQFTMLIVDDSWVTRKTIRSAIGKLHADWDFVEADSAEDALEKMEDAELGLAAVDYHMPGMNGLDLIPRIQTRYDGIPVMLVTAARTRSIREEAAMLGVHLLNKPFNLDGISNCLSALGIDE